MDHAKFAMALLRAMGLFDPTGISLFFHAN